MAVLGFPSTSLRILSNAWSASSNLPTLQYALMAKRKMGSVREQEKIPSEQGQGLETMKSRTDDRESRR